ncbi:hypothetical protein ACFLZ7_01880 [Nanoarchaeota archaeon]
MDNFMLIRSGIFLVAGLICIIFQKQLNNVKNRFFTKLNIRKKVKDERKSYVKIGIIFIIISVILFIYSILN